MQAEVLKKLSDSLPEGVRTKASKKFSVSAAAITLILKGEIKSDRSKKVIKYLIAETIRHNQEQRKLEESINSI